MKHFHILSLVVCLVTIGIVSSATAGEKQSASRKAGTQELIGKIVSVDLPNSTIDLEYEFDDQTHQMKTDAFYITDATIIDVATVKSSLKDLKAGSNVLLEYAQMPDGAKVVESLWVKKA